MRAALLLPLCLAAAWSACGKETQLAATGADPVAIWKQKAASVAEVVEEALRRHDRSAQRTVTHVDLESLRIWHGQRLDLALEVDSLQYKFFTESEPDWRALTEALPPAQGSGGVVPATDWDSLERDWVAPLAMGPRLPDFTLEGPLDLYLRTPVALPMFLPHAVDVGRVQRVLLREGACVTVRGARSVGLRRPVELPALSLSDFANLVTTDAEAHPAAGILHLLSGVRTAAERRWNTTHPDLSLAVVALELDLSPQAAALLSAPSPVPGQGLQRLKPRRLKEGVVELVPRDSLSPEESKAVALADSAHFAWPLRSVHPQHLQAYEKLLREVLGSHIFSGGRLAQQAQQRGQRQGQGGQQAGGVRVQPDLQLRLQRTQAEAMTLLQLRLEVERREKPEEKAATEGEDGSVRSEGGSSGSEEAKGGGGGEQRGGEAQEGSAAVAAAAEGGAGGKLEQPPDAFAKLVQPKYGPHEVWDAVVQVKQDPESGALRFVPVKLNRADATKETVSFSPSALGELVRMPGNASVSASALQGQQGEHEEL